MTHNDDAHGELGERHTVEHELKCWPYQFQVIIDGRKPFEIRLNDREFRVGDTLFLREWDQMSFQYSGRECRRVVTHITDWEQKPNHVVMGLKAALKPPEQPEGREERDAKRYRWLRLGNAEPKDAYAWFVENRETAANAPDNIDAAIDAARALAEQKAEGGV